MSTHFSWYLPDGIQCEIRGPCLELVDNLEDPLDDLVFIELVHVQGLVTETNACQTHKCSLKRTLVIRKEHLEQSSTLLLRQICCYFDVTLASLLVVLLNLSGLLLLLDFLVSDLLGPGVFVCFTHCKFILIYVWL